MAAVAVAADNLRADNMDTDTNCSAIGSGPGTVNESDVIYQGSGSVSRKAGTTEKGLASDTGAARDMTATGRETYIVKAWLTNYSSTATSGNYFRVRVGSASGAYYYYEYGSPTVDYPAKGGWVIDAIDPSIASHRDGTTGSPTLTAMAWFGAVAKASTSKTENLAVDSIDIGTGLYLTAGDGASDDGVFQDFTDDDEGDTTNGRFGYVTTIDGVQFVLGKLYIGATVASAVLTSAVTEFTDTGGTTVWSENKAAAGFSGLILDLGNASTVINITRRSLGSRGTVAGEDTRAIFEVTGSSGEATLTGCPLDGFASITLNVATTLTDCVITNSGLVDAGDGADLAGTTIASSTAATDASSLEWDVNLDPNGELDNMSFAKGTNAHHAIELGLTSPLTVTLTGHVYSGFNASNAQNDSTIYVARTSGTVTINVAGGGDTPSYKTAGAVVVIVNSVTVRVTAVEGDGTPIQNAYVFLKASTGGPLPYRASVSITQTAGTATVTHTTHGYSTGQEVLIEDSTIDAYNSLKTITVTTANAYTYPIDSGTTSPATGTIVSTAVILSGLTNASGIVEDTGFNFVSNQDVIGDVKKGTSSPVYVPAPLTGTIVSGSGLSIVAPMGSDE
ncbi:MAG: hypothetical protein DRQ40_08655 [Gammaproteobacteria bacterium]|nr:MAG: hypothetical protein DRQ40_08655 [Gammaproteobacteria bacterium]